MVAVSIREDMRMEALQGMGPTVAMETATAAAKRTFLIAHTI